MRKRSKRDKLRRERTRSPARSKKRRSEPWRERIEKPRPTIRRVAEPEALDDGWRDPAAGKIAQAFRMAAELLSEVRGRGGQGRRELASVAACLLRHRDRRLADWQSDPSPSGKVLDGLREAPAACHDKADGIPSGMTAEAEEEPALGVDAERRGVLRMEGTEPVKPRSPPFERRVLFHQSGEVGLLTDREKGVLGKGHSGSLTFYLLSPRSLLPEAA